ncbi:MAG: ATP-binding protein [Deltaproteobacteria bacterium]|nr:ATP-binding protein [Deltaproteobacteria bacterium]
MTGIPEQVLDILVADNPWLQGRDISYCPAVRALPDKFIPRNKQLNADYRVCLVVGPRQAGKSTAIVHQLVSSDRPFLYLNCEEFLLKDWLQSPALFADAIPNLISEDTPIFFEEIQHLDQTGLFLKGLVDRRIGPLYATGSAAFELDDAVRESLAGRALRHLLLPFSLNERAFDVHDKPVILRERRHVALAKEMALDGGYPPVVLSEMPHNELTTLVESFVIKDASDRFRIRNIPAFRKILELAASQIGNLCNYSEWASIAGISVESAREYTSLLVEAHVIRLVPPFVGGKRAEITSTPKVFFLDNGVRNRLFGGFSPLARRSDHGALIENYVFTELSKSINPLLDEIRFWRSKSRAEVDFVVIRSGEIEAWEVKAGDAGGRISRSARSFIDAYKPAQFYVVNSATHNEIKIEETTIQFLLPHQVESKGSAPSLST